MLKGADALALKEFVPVVKDLLADLEGQAARASRAAGSRSRIWTMEVDSFDAIINRVNSLWTLGSRTGPGS